MPSDVKQRDFSPVYGLDNVCTRSLSSERCSPLTLVWLTQYTGELKIIMVELKFVGFWTLTMYWFSVVKRKICRVVDTWKSRYRYLLGAWVQSWVSENIPSVATWRWWMYSPSVGGSPSAPSFVLENTIHTFISALCSPGLWNSTSLSFPCLWLWARLTCHSSAVPWAWSSWLAQNTPYSWVLVVPLIIPIHAWDYFLCLIFIITGGFF